MRIRLLSDIIGVYNKMHPDDRKRILDFLYKARLGEVRDFKGEIRILHPGTEDSMELGAHQCGSQSISTGKRCNRAYQCKL